MRLCCHPVCPYVDQFGTPAGKGNDHQQRFRMLVKLHTKLAELNMHCTNVR